MTTAADIKATIDIVEIIGEYVSLEKSGQYFKAVCPFHSEKTASFFVFPERKSWRCFGACAEGGDVFSFLMKQENLSFVEALKNLADHAGINVPDNTRIKANENEKILVANQFAAEYYQDLLKSSPLGNEARIYVDKRHISANAIEDFQLGFSPSNWDALKTHLKNLGINETTQLQAGLLVRNENGSIYDRFRNRLMFPIQDMNGKVVGFGGRTLDETNPKYLNTAKSPVFDKGALLYGIHHSQKAIQESKTVVIVEGYTDVIQAHQHGSRNVVASMGTALTVQQVKLLRGLAKRFILALDSDTAGQAATRRSLESSWGIFNRSSIPTSGRTTLFGPKDSQDIRIATLPNGVDPDDLINRDPTQWEICINEAPEVLNYLFEWESSQTQTSSSADKQLTIERLFPLIAALENSFEQDHYFNKLAHILEIDEKALIASIGRLRSPQRNIRKPREVVTSALETIGRDPLEEHLLTLLVQSPELHIEILGLESEVFWLPQNRHLYELIKEKGPDFPKTDINSIFAERIEEFENIALPSVDGKAQKEALISCAERLKERHIRGIIRDQKALDGASTGNFSNESDRIAALERASQLTIKFKAID
jgi:DNA primase